MLCAVAGRFQGWWRVDRLEIEDAADAVVDAIANLVDKSVRVEHRPVEVHSEAGHCAQAVIDDLVHLPSGLIERLRERGEPTLHVVDDRIERVAYLLQRLRYELRDGDADCVAVDQVSDLFVAEDLELAFVRIEKIGLQSGDDRVEDGLRVSRPICQVMGFCQNFAWVPAMSQPRVKVATLRRPRSC